MTWSVPSYRQPEVTMIPVQRTALVLLLAVLVCLAGMVETVTDRNWDLAAVLGVVVALQVAALVGLRVGRRPTSLRTDLDTWVHEHAVATGEAAPRLVDRCVAAYRAGLGTDGRDRS